MCFLSVISTNQITTMKIPLFVALILSVQSPSLLAHPVSTDPATLFYEGLLVMKSSGDTLKGRIQMGSAKYGKKFIVLKQDTLTRPVEKSTISFIRLYYKDPDSIKKFTDFKPLNFENNVFWRLLGSGKAEVFDNELFPYTEKYTRGKSDGDLSAANIYDLVVASPGGTSLERIPIGSVTWGVPKKRNHFLIEYINKRYKGQLKKADFQSNGEMIRYIIDHG
jgi:hypothetical protein